MLGEGKSGTMNIKAEQEYAAMPLLRGGKLLKTASPYFGWMIGCDHDGQDTWLLSSVTSYMTLPSNTK